MTPAFDLQLVLFQALLACDSDRKGLRGRDKSHRTSSCSAKGGHVILRGKRRRTRVDELEAPTLECVLRLHQRRPAKKLVDNAVSFWSHRTKLKDMKYKILYNCI